MTYIWIKTRHLRVGDTIRTDGGAPATVTADHCGTFTLVVDPTVDEE